MHELVRRIFEICIDFLSIPVYIGNYHFTYLALFKIFFFGAIVAVIFGLITTRAGGDIDA